MGIFKEKRISKFINAHNEFELGQLYDAIGGAEDAFDNSIDEASDDKAAAIELALHEIIAGAKLALEKLAIDKVLLEQEIEANSILDELEVCDVALDREAERKTMVA